MTRFNFHLSGSPLALCVETDADTTQELGERLGRQRFVTGLLLRQGSDDVDPPVEVLVLAHRVLVVAREN